MLNNCLLLANSTNTNEAKKLKMTETLAHRYSSESTHLEEFNEYQHDRVWILVLDESSLSMGRVN